MFSPVLIVTGIAASLGFCLNSTVLYLVLTRGRKLYHFLFAGVLFACAIWDMGVFLLVVRNNHPQELVTYSVIASWPASFIPALIYHFTYEYTRRKRVWELFLVWGITISFYIMMFSGVFWNIVGLYNYSWGNMFQTYTAPALIPLVFLFWFAMILTSAWFLYRESRTSSSRLRCRHCRYIMAGFLAMSIAVLKALVTIGVDLPFLLPMGMILNDLFVALIGVAIVKDRLFDITVIIKKGALYSALAALIIFVFSFSEHVFTTYLAEWIGGHSELMHFLSIAIVIAVLMPIKSRLERTIEHYFTQKRLKLEF